MPSGILIRLILPINVQIKSFTEIERFVRMLQRRNESGVLPVQIALTLKHLPLIDKMDSILLPITLSMTLFVYTTSRSEVFKRFSRP